MPLTLAWASLSTRIWPAPESARLIPAKSNWQSLTVWFTGLTVWSGVKKRNTTQSHILNQSETIWIHLRHTLHTFHTLHTACSRRMPWGKGGARSPPRPPRRFECPWDTGNFNDMSDMFSEPHHTPSDPRRVTTKIQSLTFVCHRPGVNAARKIWSNAPGIASRSSAEMKSGYKHDKVKLKVS